MPLNQVDISMMQDIPAPGVSGKIIISDGTDWTSGENAPIVDLSQLSASNLTTGTVATARLGTGTADSTKFLRGDNTWQVVAMGATQLDSPVITGTLSVTSGGEVTHTVANWSDDASYTITPTNCTAGSVNASGEFVITHTSGSPSYTIKATTASLGLADSALTTKNLSMQLTAPTLSSPADVSTVTDVTYTITSTDANDNKLILDPNTANFTYQSVSGGGTASKVGNTVECVGFGANNPVVIIRFTAEATYSVTAQALDTGGTYGASALSSADSIAISDFEGMVSTGGTITTDGDYKVHTFNASSDFVISDVGSNAVVEYLVIAGGGSGGGGTYYGGGAGAGGYRTATNFSVSATTYTITVGAGASSSSSGGGANGSNSTFSSITSTGGGSGGGRTLGAGVVDGGNGGSGGGSGFMSVAGAASPAGQGNAGGSAANPTGTQLGGGGGGAGSAGVSAQASPMVAGAGGSGLYSSITGSSVPRGGGGGGGYYYETTAVPTTGAAGVGGGTAGHNGATSNATANTGGGSGGAERFSPATSGNGGSGVVIIRVKFQ